MTIREVWSGARQRLASDRWALVPLRLVIGFGFAAHGFAKLGRGPESFAAVVAAMGIPAPVFMSWLTTLLELVGGIGLMLGAGVVPLSLPLGATMLTALFGVHLRYGFSSIKLLALGPAGAQFGPPGIEVNLTYIAALVTLALAGTTPLSVDRWLASRRSR